MSEIQLTSANGFNVNNIIFSKPQAGGLKDTSVKFRRIYLSTKYADGSDGDLIISTPRIFSFGVSENTSQDDKNKANGFVFPLVLFDKNGASDEEKIFLDTFNKIVSHTKKHILDNKKELKLPSIDESDLKKFNPIFYKKDKDTGDVAADALPTLYLKVALSKKDGVEKILSTFYDKRTGTELNPLDLLKKYCWTTAAIKFESIFIGSKISFQVKLYEAEVELLNSGRKRLLPRPQASIKVEIDDDKGDDDNEDLEDLEDVLEDNTKEDDVSSIMSDVDETPPEPVKTVKKITKVVKKKKGE
jgi:hypothetical protein